MNNIGIFVFECLPGTQTFVHDGLRHLTAFRPHVLTKLFNPRSPFDFSSHPLYPQYQSTTITRVMLYYMRPRFFGSPNIHRLLSWRDRIPEYIREHRLCLVHAHFSLDGLYALTFTEQCNIPLVVSLHGGYDVNVTLRMPGFPRDSFFGGTAHFTVPCSLLREQLIALGCPSSKVSVLPNGIPLDASHENIRNNNNGLRLLLVGRMTEKKGILDALKAVARLVPKYPDIRLTIITGQPSGPDDSLKKYLSALGFSFPFRSAIGYRNAVNRYITASNLTDRVTIVHAVPHKAVWQLMHNSDIFLLPSKTASDGDMEGMPVVLLEAQAAGLPVITTHHSGNPEAVVPDKSAFLVAEGNVDALTERLDFLIQNPQARREMGTAGKTHVTRNFGIDTYCQSLETIFHTVLDNRRPRISKGC